MPYETSNGAGLPVGPQLYQHASDCYPSRCVRPRGVCPRLQLLVDDLTNKVVGEAMTMDSARDVIAMAGASACKKGVTYVNTGRMDQQVVACGDSTRHIVGYSPG